MAPKLPGRTSSSTTTSAMAAGYRPSGRESNGVHKPEVPRAYQAVDRDHPNGSEGLSLPTMTVLQAHCAFWDRDNDGRIYPSDTYTGFRELGFSVPVSLLMVWALHFTLLLPFMTCDSWLVHPYLPIYLKNIHRAKHGSDTEVYDEEGRFVPQRFEGLWEEYGGGKDALDWGDIKRLLAGKKNVGDPLGWLASTISWRLLWALAKDTQGMVSREAVRSCYDGTLFYAVAERRRVAAWSSKYE